MGRTVEVADLVGTAEIAERLGRHRNMAHTWLRLYPAFPRPVARLAIGHVWSWADIEAWAVEPAPAVRAAARFADAADLASSPEIAARLGRPRNRSTVGGDTNAASPTPSSPWRSARFGAGPTSKPWRAETQTLKRPVQASSRLEQNRPTPSPAARRLFVQLVRLDGIRFGSGRCVPPGAEPVASTLRSLTGNPEPMPAALCAALDLPPGSTYTDGVSRWMADHRIRPVHLGSHTHTGRQPGRPVVRPTATSSASRDSQHCAP